MRLLTCFPIMLLLALLSCKTEPPAEHSPESSLADLKVYDGLEVSLFASEPMFTNPTNMDIDSRGRVWITEAYNYRNQYNPRNPLKKEGDRIMILEDTDGDGKADKSKVFYQGTDVNAALGITVLGNKVIVSCSPNVFVFTDENGDDVPEKKEILFQGIKGIQHDHAIHAFTFGPDGKLYFNMGNEGSVLVDAKGDTVVDVYGNKVSANGRPYRDGMALRCNEDGTGVEVIGFNFRNNYELTPDPYGTVWQSDNDDDGNKSTRINYVMEFGNFGYRDEITGASWGQRRTNIEKEIPFRHWHLNDPGVVPNMLQTGSGSPTGILMYEGSMLPDIFKGQLIHAEPGHNVVRSYTIASDGAGYRASIVNILEGQKDQWFRPADVTIAPDGSLFVADWYDPGVGGHQVGDLDKGRIYRISRKEDEYKFQPGDFSSPESAGSLLHSPNVATRYIAFQAIKSFGEKSIPMLTKYWTGNDERARARAFWLLVTLPGGEKYISDALKDKSGDIRIMAIRAARMLKQDPTVVLSHMVKDPSPQVRRELALALHNSAGPTGAAMWVDLALQYDGKDRWYLEALGIGAAQNWDEYFAAWLKRVGGDWNTEANRDIVWRSRAKAALPLLGELIKESDEKTMLRYYRAFDFHRDVSKQKVLANLVASTTGNKVLYGLKHMDATKLKMTPVVSAALNKALDEHKGSLEYVELATIFNLRKRAPELLQVALVNPDSAKGREAMKTLMSWDMQALIRARIDSSTDEAEAVLKTLKPMMYNPKAIALMEDVMLDTVKNVEIRKMAVANFGGPWESEDYLLEMAKNKKIPADLQSTAAGVFQTAWRATLRDEAAKYLTLPGSKEGTSLPPVSVLMEKKGDVAKGREVFKTLCSTCHQVNKDGVNFGPDLSEIGGKLSSEALYTAILYPDRGISFGYEGFRIKLGDGSAAFGRIVSETADKIEMQYMIQQQTVNKVDIVSRVQLSSSLMPSNLQSSMTQQELIDLVEYLKGLASK
jgi:putative membrane-bound dehydrogenase-like protein